MKLNGIHAVILKYMQTNKGGLTVKDCIDNLGTTELRKIISDLKDSGWKFSDVWETGTNRWGETTRYKRYFLIGRKK